MFSSISMPVRRTWIAAAVITLAGFTTACEDSTSPPEPVRWETLLASNMFDAVAAVNAGGNSFAAAIEIENGDENDTFSWRVAEGTCAEPGERLGAANRYAALEIAADGTAEAQATVAGVTLEEDGDYIVAVLDESGDEPVYVACGALSVAE